MWEVVHRADDQSNDKATEPPKHSKVTTLEMIGPKIKKYQNLNILLICLIRTQTHDTKLNKCLTHLRDICIINKTKPRKPSF